jgi:hypothetical protein
MKISDDSRTGCAAVVGWSERTAGSGQSFVIARGGALAQALQYLAIIRVLREYLVAKQWFMTLGAPRVCLRPAIRAPTIDNCQKIRDSERFDVFSDTRTRSNRGRSEPSEPSKRGERVLAPHDPRPATVVSGDRDDPPRQAGLEIATPEILPSLLRRRWACSSWIRRLEGCNVTAAWQPERLR